MNKSDELEQLWQTQPVLSEIRGEEMREIIMQKMTKFDRTIGRRNLREVSGSELRVFFSLLGCWLLVVQDALAVRAEMYLLMLLDLVV